MKKILLFLAVLLLETIMMIIFYSPFERMYIYWSLVTILVIINILATILLVLFRKGNITNIRFSIYTGVYVVIIGCLYIFSYFQFNYVIMPYNYFNNEIFYVNYSYEDLVDDVRIEYYARDYYGEEEIYRISYDKNEIEQFLNLFRDIRLLTEEEYEEVGYQQTNIDWHNDIHVMIRNMDDSDAEDGNSGYYVFSINLVDTSIYAMKNNGSFPQQIYLVTDELRQFILDHLY